MKSLIKYLATASSVCLFLITIDGNLGSTSKSTPNSGVESRDQIDDVSRLTEEHIQGEKRHVQISRSQRESQMAKYGKCEPALYDVLQAKGPEDEVKVGIWLNMDRDMRNETKDLPRNSQIETSTRMIEQITAPMVSFLQAAGYPVLYASQFAPVVFSRLPQSAILSLEERPDVNMIYLSRKYKSHLASAVRSVRADEVWQRGITGADEFGIDYYVGVVEVPSADVIGNRSTGLTATTLTDNTNPFGANNSKAGWWLNPNTNQQTSWIVASNTNSTLTTAVGDMTTVAAVGDRYKLVEDIAIQGTSTALTATTLTNNAWGAAGFPNLPFGNANSKVGWLINPNTNRHDWFVVTANTATTVTVAGGLNANAAVGNEYILAKANSRIDNTHPHLTVTASYLPNSLRSEHATMVAGVIASTHAAGRGVAWDLPGLLSVNAPTQSDVHIIAASDWAVAQDAHILNCSFGADNGMDLLARYYDYIVRHEFVTVTCSSGNDGDDAAHHVESPAVGWNVIAVGAFDDQNTPDWNDDIMVGSPNVWSDWREPGGFGDREKPEVAAVGVDVRTTTYPGGGLTAAPGVDGTSFASPAVAGEAALLVSRKRALIDEPEVKKAIIMASANHNIEGDQRLSEQDGAGGIVCSEADEIAVLDNYFSTSLTAADFAPDYRRVVPLQGNARTRIALCWDSNAGGPPNYAGDVLNADFDLYIHDPNGTVVTSSLSSDNSYEIVDFKTTVSGDYTIVIDDFRFDGASEPIGLAWHQKVTDYGDAPDPPYPSLFASDGARHSHFSCEWLGTTIKIRVDHPAASHELDANDASDSDGQPNLNPRDLDRYDDGVEFFPQYNPCASDFERVWVYMSVDSASKADGRYGDGKYLILNAWFDWNGDGDFRDRFTCPAGEANEHIIWLRAEPSDGIVNTLPDTNFIVNPNGWIMPDGSDCDDFWYILYFRVPPDNVMTRNSLWSRFRLEYDNTWVVGWPVSSSLFNGTELGPAFYGEVEDYCLKIDYGDAKDGPYPTLKSSNGARHFDGCKEWLGNTLSGEFDARDNLDSDGIKNLEPWDTDQHDDGIVFPLELKSGSCVMKNVKVTMSVLNKDYLWTVEPYTYRYGIVDQDTFCLVFNAWVDWTFDRTWDTQNTCVVPGDASDHLLWQAVSPHDSSVVCAFPTHNFRVNPRKWTSNTQIYELTFWMPAHDVDTLWARGRLEYTDWPHHQKVPGSRTFNGTYKGESYYGEVEDYFNAGPVMIRMSSFSAAACENYVEIEWTTGAEIDIAGFNIHRSVAEDTDYVRINEELIPSQGSEIAEASYCYTDADVEKGKMYYYKIEAVDIAENSTWYGPISVTLGETDVADGPTAPIPEVFGLDQNYPNPFNVETDIRYQIPQASSVTLTIYNLLGQEVVTLVDQRKEAGYYSVHWDGRDASGIDVTSGIYFYRIVTEKWTGTKKMALLR